MPTLTFATRPSKLARWQTTFIAQSLEQAWPGLTCREVLISTQGDRIINKPLPEIGGKGLFTQELEQELLAGRVDAAVHSLKDLPIENSPGLTIGVIPKRAAAGDVLICPEGYTLDKLPTGAIVGTSSLRRQAQILSHRPDIQVRPIRGNVDTRIRKAEEGQYDAIVLAEAGISRLGLEEHITQHLSWDIMLPAPGQGALAVQCRADDADTLQYLSALEDLETRISVTAERALLAALGGGCSLPVGAHATYDGDLISMQGVIAEIDGGKLIHVQGRGAEPHELGAELAQQALAQGAGEMLHV